MWCQTSSGLEVSVLVFTPLRLSFTPSQLPKLVWLSMFIFTFHSNGANAKIYDAKCSGPTASAQIHGAKCSGPNS